MNLRRACFVAACMIPLAAATARAQSQPAPQGPPPQMSPCVQEFVRLRADTEKKANAIKMASERKASPKDACNLFNVFSTAEEKLIKYANDNAAWCGIPPQLLDGMAKGHARTTEMRTRICRIAATAPAAPRGPSLSDALTAPVTSSSNIRTGGGTFDTLTGSPLGK